MSLGTNPYKGSRDFYPQDKRTHNYLIGALKAVAQSFGYQEYDGPMIEPFDLYAAKTGQEIVEKQLYSFEDRGGRKVAIRPEMTPTLARMIAARLGELPQPVRWFSCPNLWRYERPQKGRLREHWQMNVDILGGDSQLADTEILFLAFSCLESFGAHDKIRIRVNHREFCDFVFKDKMKLDPSQQHQLVKLLDAKEKISDQMYSEQLSRIALSSDQITLLNLYLELSLDDLASDPAHPFSGAQSIQSLQEVLNFFKGTDFEESISFDPLIMRGLDYYTGIVFEAFDVSPENNRALFGGGRYDNLLSMFGKKNLSGVGFGLGDVVLENFLKTHSLLNVDEEVCDVFVTLTDEKYAQKAFELSHLLRKKGLKVLQSMNVSNFPKQLKLANRSNSRFAILFSDQEWSEGNVLLKNLSSGAQKEVEFSKVYENLEQNEVVR